MELLEFSLESFRDESFKLALMVEESGYKPDCVAYLAKGAWQIGEVCADYFHVPIIELTAHRSGDAAKGSIKSILQLLPVFLRKALREAELHKRLNSTSGNVSAQKKNMRLTDRFEVPDHVRNVLLVDDAADTGRSLSAATELLESLMPNCEVRTAVITSFAPARSAGVVDYCIHPDALLCSPMSKDNKDYAKAVRGYENFNCSHMSQGGDSL